jgi:hypothetical protein
MTLEEHLEIVQAAEEKHVGELLKIQTLYQQELQQVQEVQEQQPTNPGQQEEQEEQHRQALATTVDALKEEHALRLRQQLEEQQQHHQQQQQQQHQEHQQKMATALDQVQQEHALHLREQQLLHEQRNVAHMQQLSHEQTARLHATVRSGRRGRYLPRPNILIPLVFSLFSRWPNWKGTKNACPPNRTKYWPNFKPPSPPPPPPSPVSPMPKHSVVRHGTAPTTTNNQRQRALCRRRPNKCGWR